MATYLAIDIDAQGLYVVSGTSKGGSAKVDRVLAWVPGDEHGPPPLSADTAKTIGEGLRDRLKKAHIPLGPALVSIGRDKVILKEIRYPQVPPSEEPAVVRFQALKEITESPDDVVLDYVPLSSSGASGEGEKRATAVVVRKDVYAAIQAMCQAAGLRLAAVTPRPFAIAAGLVKAFATGTVPPPSASIDAVAVLTLGTHGGEFTVVRDGHASFTRSVPSQVLTNEALLRSEVKRNLTVYGGQDAGHPIRAVYLAEADDLVGGWAGRLREGLPVPLFAFDPVADCGEPVAAERRGRFAGAAGLLVAKAHTEGLPINFVSPRQPRSAADPRRKQYAFIGLAAAVLIGGLALFGYLQVARADARVHDLQAEKDRLESVWNQLEPDRKRLDAVDQWSGREVNYLDELFEMSDRLPANDQIRLTEFKGTARPVDKNGKQDSQSFLELRGGSKNAEAPAAIVSAIDRDNAGKNKYYVGTAKTIPGSLLPNVVHNQPFTITTKVNHRSPAEYAETPLFTPPPRRGFITLAPPSAIAEPPGMPEMPPTKEPDEDPGETP